MHSMGAVPVSTNDRGQMVNRIMGLDVTRDSRGKFGFSEMPGFDKMSWRQKGPMIGYGLFQVGASIYPVYHGYQEDGFYGAYQAAVWDVATNAAMVRFGYGTPGHGVKEGAGGLGKGTRGSKIPGTELKSGGMGKFFGRYVGAGIGAAVGQAVLGTPGAFIGGYIGAAPVTGLKNIASSRLGVAAVGATVAAGAVGWASYGAYHVVKGVAQAGYAHAQARKGIDTSGDMAAFMTKGAFSMRERAVQAIHKSHINARSALGQEANFMHSNRNYHSRWR